MRSRLGKCNRQRHQIIPNLRSPTSKTSCRSDATSSVCGTGCDRWRQWRGSRPQPHVAFPATTSVDGTSTAETLRRKHRCHSAADARRLSVRTTGRMRRGKHSAIAITCELLGPSVGVEEQESLLLRSAPIIHLRTREGIRRVLAPEFGSAQVPGVLGKDLLSPMPRIRWL